MRPWKRLVVIGLSIGAGISVLLALIGGIYWWIEVRPTPPKTWPVLDIEAIGVHASLVTRWHEGRVEYQFRVWPLDPSLAEAFDKVANPNPPTGAGAMFPWLAKPPDRSFTVHFYDSSDFEICNIPMVGLHPQVSGTGLTDAMVANDRSSSCSSSDYRNSQKRNISYQFPKLTAESAEQERRE